MNNFSPFQNHIPSPSPPPTSTYPHQNLALLPHNTSKKLSSPSKIQNENLDPKIRAQLAAHSKEKALLLQKLEFKTMEISDLQQSFSEYKQVTEKMIKSLQNAQNHEENDEKLLAQK